MRVIIYCRVSTDGQERDGTSLESQEAQGLAFARAAGWHVAEVVRDTASGYTLDRPGMDRMRALLRRGEADVLLAHAVDRLSRNQTHIGVLVYEVQRAGAKLECVTEKFEDTPEGRFILAARALVAEVEREKILERTARGKEVRARSGQLVQGTGRGIYGYELCARGRGGDGTRRIVPAQAAVVRRIFAEFARGDSVHAIAARLTAEGVETLQGWEYHPDGTRRRRIPWYPLTVRRILQNQAYTGRTVYRRTRIETFVDPRTGRKKRRTVPMPEELWIEIPNATPAIVDRTLWEQAQALLADPPHRARRGHAIYPYALAGHVRCDGCCAPLAGSALSGGAGRNRIRYYGCRNRNLPDRAARCRSRYVRAEDLETRLVAAVCRVLADPMQIVAAYNALQAGAAPMDGSTVADAEQRIADAQAQLRRLAKLARFSDDEAVTATLAEEMRAAAQGKRAAEAELARLRAQGQPPEPIIADPAAMAALSERVAAWLDPSDKEKMRLALEGLAITVWAGTGEPRATGELPVPSRDATLEPNDHADVRAMVISRHLWAVCHSGWRWRFERMPISVPRLVWRTVVRDTGQPVRALPRGVNDQTPVRFLLHSAWFEYSWARF